MAEVAGAQALPWRLLLSLKVAEAAEVARGCVLSMPHPIFLRRWLSPSATAVRVVCAVLLVLRAVTVVLVATRHLARC